MITTEKKIVHAHDRTFKAILSDPRVAKDFFDHHLPAEIKEKIDLDSIEIEKESYIDDSLDLVECDILFSADFKEESKSQRCFLYLLVEHLSNPDPLAAWRKFKYVCRVIDDNLKKSENKELPIVIPIVVYNGKSKYPYSTSVYDLFGENKTLAKAYMFDQFYLID